MEVVILAKLPYISLPQFHLLPLGALVWRRLVAKVQTSNQDRTISLKAAVCSCTNKQTPLLPSLWYLLIYCVVEAKPWRPCVRSKKSPDFVLVQQFEVLFVIKSNRILNCTSLPSALDFENFYKPTVFHKCIVIPFYLYILIIGYMPPPPLWCCDPTQVMASSFLRSHTMMHHSR
jgi:hypothetical protein